MPVERAWLRACLERGEEVVLVGDSAGGNVVLCLGMWWAAQLCSPSTSNADADGDGDGEGEREARRGETETPVEKAARGRLTQILAISPATDLRNTNPAIHTTAPHDPTLTPALIESVARAYAGALPRSDPSISPICADFRALRDSGVRVHGVIGTNDVLGPDALVFRARCEREGIRGAWLVWEGQMHCFPLVAVYGVGREGGVAVGWICDVLKGGKGVV